MFVMKEEYFLSDKKYTLPIGHKFRDRPITKSWLCIKYRFVWKIIIDFSSSKCLLPSPLCAGGERNKQGTGEHWRNSFCCFQKLKRNSPESLHIFLDLVLAHQIGSELVVCSSTLSHSHLPQPEWKVDSTYRSTDMCPKLEKSNLGSRKSSSGSISGCLKSIVRRTW